MRGLRPRPLDDGSNAEPLVYDLYPIRTIQPHHAGARAISDLNAAPAGASSPDIETAVEPLRIPRDQHPVSRKQIAPGTLKVLYTLKDAGYEAYMVGGGVRDLLAGMEPKDFDVATSAHPEEVRKLFRSSRLVGRRFLIAHVRMGDEIVEVTTFRGAISNSHDRDETGRILSDNVYGTLETDAFRRDFTINALYYDIRDFSIVDYCGGIDDMENRVLRLIGDPELRYREDPVRMLRAVRIAAKLQFDIEPTAAALIPKLASLLREIPPARLFDEVLKLLLSRDAVANFDGLRRHGLFSHLFPQTDEAVEADPAAADLVRRALANTASRIEQGLPVTPAFLFGALLWAPYSMRVIQLQREQGHVPIVAQTQAAEEVLAAQQLRIAIPKRFSVPMREIWITQGRFENRRSGPAKRLLTHPRFRAAYDFLLLRAQAGEEGAPVLADWWTQAQAGQFAPVSEPMPEHAPAAPGAPPAKKKRRRRGGRKPRGPAAGDTAHSGDDTG